MRLQIADRGLATSTSLVRRWRQGGEERHHLIDPRSGRPAEAQLASVTAIAAHGWQAEALAKGAFLSTPEDALQLLAANDATGLLVDLDGRIHPAPGPRPLPAHPAPETRRGEAEGAGAGQAGAGQNPAPAALAGYPRANQMLALISSQASAGDR